MTDPLFPYQLKGAEWLSKSKLALLADEMGLGKSAQAIRACDLVGAERILVICPAVARQNWIREFERFSKFSRTLTPLLSRRSSQISPGCIVSSYDLVHSNLSSLKGPWDCLILDESHYLKSLGTKRTKAIFGRDGICRDAKRVWALSGTPAPNHPAELWPMLYTFGITQLKFDQFVERFCTYYESGYGPKITGTRTEKIPELKMLLNQVMLRRRKDEVMTELPPIHYTDIVVEAGPVDLEIESSFVQYIFPTDRREELFKKLEDEKNLVEGIVDTAGMGRDGMTALASMAQSVSTLRRYTGLQKVQSVADLLTEELESNAYEKVVVFAIHRDVIEGLRVKLSKFGAVTLYGGTEPERRQKNIDKFQKSPKTRVFIGNILAAGTAITLTSAHNVVFIEQDWVPGNNAQAAMRCHRIGQKNPVVVRFCGLANSIDEKVSQVLKRKTRELTAIFDERALPAVNADDTTLDIFS